MTAMRKIPGLLAGAMALLQSACQPTYNWRDIGFEGTNVKTQLPCKPDRTQKEVTMAQTRVTLQVAGCEAGGGMWVVMTGQLPASVDPAEVLQGWQAAAWRTLKAQNPAQQTWLAAKALPGAVRVRAQGLQPNGQPTQAQGVWVAWPEGEGVQWVNAMVYQSNIQGETADTFFESIRQP
jgi:hypothetical protein